MRPIKSANGTLHEAYHEFQLASKDEDWDRVRNAEAWMDKAEQAKVKSMLQ